MTKELNTISLGLRKHNEMMEDFSLETPIEKAIYDGNYKSFEMLFKACC